MSERILSKNPGERAKSKFFSALATSNISVMRILRDNGLLKTKGSLERVGEEDIWRNVSEHCLSQAAVCYTLAELLDLPKESQNKLVKAALVHDHDKKYQSTGLKQIQADIESGQLTEKEGGKEKYVFFEESEEHSFQNLIDYGIDEDVVQIASADGHSAIPRIIDGCSLEEEVFHYAGSITSENDIVPLSERISKLETASRYRAMNEYGQYLDWTKGKTLYQVQKQVGQEYEDLFALRIIKARKISPEQKEMLIKNVSSLPLVIREYLFSVIIPRETQSTHTESPVKI